MLKTKTLTFVQGTPAALSTKPLRMASLTVLQTQPVSGCRKSVSKSDVLEQSGREGFM